MTPDLQKNGVMPNLYSPQGQNAITTAAGKLEKVSVTAEIVAEHKGPKIRILKYKNKTGYKKRQGHRQRYTQVKVSDIKA